MLRAEVRDFIGQEASHRYVHAQYNAELARQGLEYILEPIVLRHPEWMGDAEPALRTAWLWHAAEESEHKAVAFDAYLAAGGKYWRRVLWYVDVSIMFAIDTLVQTAHNLHRDGQLWRRGLFWHLLLPALQYLSPTFHPWRHDNRHLVDLWLNSNEGGYRAIGSTEPGGVKEGTKVS